MSHEQPSFDPRNSALFESAAADVRRLVAERVAVKSRTLPPVDDRPADKQVADFLLEKDGQDESGMDWITDSLGNATITDNYMAGREEVRLRFLAMLLAIRSGNDAELGRIVRAAIKMMVVPVIEGGEK